MPARLSIAMQVTLTEASKHGPVGLRRLHKPDERPGWPAHPGTLRALVLRDFLSYERAVNRHGWPLDRWTITDHGRAVLEPVERIVRDRPVYLARSGQIRYRMLPSRRWAVDDDADGNGDYTTDASKSIDTDRSPNSKSFTAVEVLVGPDELDVFARKAKEREQDRLRAEGDKLDNLDVDQRLDVCRGLAVQRRVDITGDLRKIGHLNALGRVEPALAQLVALEEKLVLRAAA